MTNIDYIIDSLKDKLLTDVLVAGYLEEAGKVRLFHPMFENVYFEFGNLFLKISSIDQYWNVKIELVNEIRCEFEIDEDDEFCIGSIRHLVLKNPEGDNFLIEMTVFVDGESKTDIGIVKRAALLIGDLIDGVDLSTVVIDPENTFGIKLGGYVELSELRESDLWQVKLNERSYAVTQVP